jgi:hypothetical protein
MYNECEPFANGKGWWHNAGCEHIDWGEDAEFLEQIGIRVENKDSNERVSRTRFVNGPGIQEN